MSPDPSPQLLELAAEYGVACDYWDWQGEHRPVSAATIVAVLAALGVTDCHGDQLDPTDPNQIAGALTESWQRHWRRTLPPCIVLREGWTPWVKVHVPHGQPVALTLELEDGGQRDVEQVDWYTPPRWVDGQEIGEATFELPGDLPLGWHRLRAHLGADTPSMTAPVVVTPARLTLPKRIEGNKRWGLMEQIYQVRSRQSWGIGDLTDLAVTARWAAGLGADFCLINPLHAAEACSPVEPSPYLPATRRFASPLYLDLTQIPEYPLLPAQQREHAEQQAGQLRQASAETIDRDAVWHLKCRVLAEIFALGRTPAREVAFRDFCRLHGQPLTDFATWCVLTEHYGQAIDQWPPDYRDPRSAAVADFSAQHADRIDFYCWLQHLMADQQAATQQAATDAGMAIGIISDLAVGVHSRGSDSWADADLLARGIKVGAPPDAFNQLGQNWQQPPWQPHALAQQGYAPFRDLIRTLLAGSGGLRIDHVIGLFRLWWIPDGASADQGAYVHYDYEAMIGILVLEAHRAGAVVIGEDLGSVQPMARTVLAERGIMGTSVLWFEWADGRPIPPEHYRELALATVTTHDLPPTAGYLDLVHVDIRARLGLLTRSVDAERAAEAAAIAAVRKLPIERGYGGDDLLALHRLLAATPSLLRGVAVADLAGDRRPINQPGTIDEYPNWRLPLADADGKPMLLEELMTAPLPAQIAAMLNPGSQGSA